MSLNIKNPEVILLARDLAKRTGESLTQVIYQSLRERFDKMASPQKKDRLFNEIMAIVNRCSSLPVLDERSADEILGYNNHGGFD